MVKKADIPKHIVDTAMNLARDEGWRDLSLADIAAAAKLPLSQVYGVYSSKQAILGGFNRMVDAQVIADEEGESSEEPAKDRLFDVVMRRLDALAPYKEALAVIAQDQMRDPLAAACSAKRLSRSMATMLEAAQLSSDGFRGMVRVKALSGVYLATLKIWFKEEAEDLPKTMAALDKYLTKVDGCARRFERKRPEAAAA
ncbi:TetR family transcriptional regulator [Denitrobaculum tricleocarpae]|uniref:TetR family transcriptional regulator n=1 Tax=Denitrobaculum tricleocarpae TaxID=2591009 RepID=A0A545U252_9PROT|nr:TetR family transcriptional regulator [Denitrobaculum tricleocarpae]TQV83557.1 TetR family transcriptional regulator [Denitrobaculum tricleocarpae]